LFFAGVSLPLVVFCLVFSSAYRLLSLVYSPTIFYKAAGVRKISTAGEQCIDLPSLIVIIPTADTRNIFKEQNQMTK